LVLIGVSRPLPVTLAEFEATRLETTALLTWSTTLEANSNRFDIERSADGKQWLTLGSVDAHGESKGLQSYSFIDKNPVTGGRAENLYRLKMVDQDGTFTYSRLRSVTFSNTGVLLYPNPVTIGEKLKLVTDNPDKISSIRIFDTSGRMVNQSAATGEINTGRLAPGLYMVQITYIDGSISTHRVVKQ
jgi:hypothetical protein